MNTPTRREPRVGRSRPIRAVPAESSSVSRRRRRPFRVVVVVVRFASSSYKMRAYLLATLERVAVVGAATATVLKEAMADMLMMCFGRCVRCVPIERDRSGRGRSSRSVGRSRVFYIGVTHQV